MFFASRSFCRITCISFSLLVALSIGAPGASAGPIVSGIYYEFGFGDVGDLATGCDPADPAGPFCVPSSGTPSTFLDPAPWTFTSGAAGSTLRVTDAFIAGDRFEVFDFGVSIGLTSLFGIGDCGDDPVPCFADPTMSQGTFALASGAHSITFAVAEGGFGAGYLLLEGDDAPPVPEPATLLLCATGVASVLHRRRRRS